MGSQVEAVTGETKPHLEEGLEMDLVSSQAYTMRLP